jgi:hypothetical protein
VKVRYLFIANTVVALIYGLLTLFIPSQLLALYDVELTAGGLIFARLFAAALLSFGLLTWLIRNRRPSSERQAIILALFLADAIGFIVTLLAQLDGTVNALGWSHVAIYLLLAIGFGYLRFAGQPGPLGDGMAG